jgi:AcrR family transcriptional regulator
VASGTRERIVQRTAELLRERGYAGTGLKAISTASGAPFGSVYHFFPDGKEELAAAALRSAADGYARHVAGVIAEGGSDLPDAMRHSFSRAARTLVDTDYADACPIATVALEVASSNEPLRQVTADIFEGWLTGLDALFGAAGLDAGTARRLSTLFLAALEGGFLLSRSARDPAPMHALGESVAHAVEAALREAPR